MISILNAIELLNTKNKTKIKPMSVFLSQGFHLQGAKQEYIIEKVLGQGTFGITYLAKFKQQVKGVMGGGTVTSHVCIKEFFMKELNSRDESTGILNDVNEVTLVSKYRKAFIREAKNLVKMNHPGIVNVFEVIETNNTVYIVMEYLDGGSLDDYITSKGRLTEDEALRLFRQICDAMDYMHSKKMLHLDMKPKNVMRDEEGHLYLIDFGLSKQYDNTGEPESSTMIGLGTAGYAPIEQAKHQDDDKTFRATIDVYALGATLYKMLTGQTPPDATEVSNSITDGGNIIEKGLLDAGVSASLASIVSKAMWSSSNTRIQSVKDLIDRLYNQPKDMGQGFAANDPTIINSNISNTTSAMQPQSKFTRYILPILCFFAGCLATFLIIIGYQSTNKSFVFTNPEGIADTNMVINSIPMEATRGTYRGHEWVDLGLPSGTKWATMNVGAKTISDYGTYFAWGETSAKDDYRWEKYKFHRSGYREYNLEFSKYCDKDSLEELELKDDAANKLWGTGWRIPSDEQYEELYENCFCDEVRMGSTSLMRLTGPNGNYILLPKAGYHYAYQSYDGSYYDSDSYSTGTYYWTRTRNSKMEAWSFTGSFYHNDRNNGLPVRPVLELGRTINYRLDSNSQADSINVDTIFAE